MAKHRRFSVASTCQTPSQSRLITQQTTTERYMTPAFYLRDYYQLCCLASQASQSRIANYMCSSIRRVQLASAFKFWLKRKEVLIHVTRMSSATSQPNRQESLFNHKLAGARQTRLTFQRYFFKLHYSFTHLFRIPTEQNVAAALFEHLALYPREVCDL